MISYDEFKKVEIKAGKIISAEKITNADKLLKLVVDFGETREVASEAPNTIDSNSAQSDVSDATDSNTDNSDPSDVTNSNETEPAPRQIVSGIAAYFPDPAVLVGKTCMFVTNLEPRTIRGFESNGMLFALSDDAGNFSLLEPSSSIKPGTAAK